MCLEPRTPIADTPAPLDLVAEVVADLCAALVNARIYAPDHPRVTGSVAAIARLLGMLPAGDGSGLRLAVAGDLLVFGEEPLVGASLAASRLIHSVRAWGGGGIELDRDGSADDLIRFLRELADHPRGDDGRDWTALNAQLTAAGVRGARLLPPFVESGGAGAGDGGPAAPLRFYQSCMDLLQDVTVAVCHGGRLDFGPVQTQVEAVLRHLDSGEGALLNLARQDQYDAFTFGHSVRVGVLATSFARALTDDHDLLVRIGTAALLHDCGKALVPFELLHSRAPLDAEQRREMSKHAQLGAEILVDHDDADPLAIASAYGHHRSTAGGGYPTSIVAHHNPMVTEVVKICDVYEALTAARPYKRPMPPIRAYRVMVGMGAHLDRALLRRFIAVNGIWPNGQRVMLSTGEQARVVAQTDDLSAPRVELLTDPGGCPVDAGTVVDLRDPRCEPRRMVLHAIDGERLA